MNFSQSNRHHFIEKLKNEEFDLLIIGGGITGCGIALDAALRGMKVALVEKSDFASGTSSRSTKLIHGGLRYLKQLEIKLVHDVGSERAIVFKNARHLVIPEKMLLPIIEGGSLGKHSTSLGLAVYDILAGVKWKERRKMLSKSETFVSEPLLANNPKVTSGGLYYEYRTDDARLVIELAKSAHANGALCLNYAEVKELLYNEDNQVCGAKIFDKIGSTEFSINAKRVVNATGPFVDLIRKEDKSLYGKRLQLTKGVHIVFSFDKLPLKQAVYFDVKDGRMIFAIPRNGFTYVGTTDTVYNQSIDSPSVNKEDTTYLVNAVNDMFTNTSVSETDIVSSWAGLRPLIHEDGKSPSELSRKDEIMISSSGLISIAGGKLTGYRLMAEKIVDLVGKQLRSSFPNLNPSQTKKYHLSGGEFSDEIAFTTFLTQLNSDKIFAQLPSDLKEKWIYRYGKNIAAILKNLETLLNSENKTKDVNELCLEAEINYSADNEMNYYAEDFIIRRTGALYFDKPFIEKHQTKLLSLLANYGKWSEQEILENAKNTTEILKAATTFD